jgi:hypothetical protein
VLLSVRVNGVFTYLEVIGYLLARNPFSGQFVFTFAGDSFECLVQTIGEFVEVVVHLFNVPSTYFCMRSPIHRITGTAIELPQAL